MLTEEVPVVEVQDRAESAERPMPWGPLLRLSAVSLMAFCSMSVVTPTIKELVRDRFALDPREVSMFMLFHSLPQILLLGLAVGLLSDRWGKRLPLAIIGCFGTGITTLLLPFPDNYNALLGLRLLDGFLGIIGLGMVMTRALDLAAGSNRSRVMAVFTMSIPLGYLLGSLFTLVMGLLNASVTSIYVVVGAGLSLTTLLLLQNLYQKEAVSAREPGVGAMWTAVKGMPRLWLPIFFGFIDKFSFALLATMPALVLADKYGQSGYLAAGGVMTAFWIAFTAAGAPAGYLTQRFGAWSVVAVGSIGYGLSLTLAVMFGSVWAFLTCIITAGAFTSLKFISNMVVISEMARPDEKATAISAFNLMGSYGLLLGFIITGISAKYLGYLTTFGITGALEILCGFLAVWAVKATVSRKDNEDAVLELRTDISTNGI